MTSLTFWHFACTAVALTELPQAWICAGLRDQVEIDSMLRIDNVCLIVARICYNSRTRLSQAAYAYHHYHEWYNSILITISMTMSLVYPPSSPTSFLFPAYYENADPTFPSAVSHHALHSADGPSSSMIFLAASTNLQQPTVYRSAITPKEDC